jgi:hypothetical protein
MSSIPDRLTEFTFIGYTPAYGNNYGYSIYEGE